MGARYRLNAPAAPGRPTLIAPGETAKTAATVPKNPRFFVASIRCSGPQNRSVRPSIGVPVSLPPSHEVLPLDALQKAVDADPVARRGSRDKRVVLRVAKTMQALRTASHLTQEAMAQRMDAQQPSIARLERGDGLRGPTVALLDRAAEACGCVLVVGWVPRGEWPQAREALAGMPGQWALADDAESPPSLSE